MGEESMACRGERYRRCLGSNTCVPTGCRRLLSPVFALLLVVIALAAANIWFVWLPMSDESANTRRSCEVYVLPSGITKCVPYWTPESAAAKQRSGPTHKD